MFVEFIWTFRHDRVFGSDNNTGPRLRWEEIILLRRFVSQMFWEELRFTILNGVSPAQSLVNYWIIKLNEWCHEFMKPAAPTLFILLSPDKNRTHLSSRSVSRSSRVQRVTSYKAGMMLCCCPRWWCGLPCAVITSPRCRDQLFRPGLIWLLSSLRHSVLSTNTTQPLKSANNPSFALFSSELSRPGVPSQATQ